MVPEDLEPWVQLSRRELRKKEHSVWLMNRQEEMLIQIKADAATRHAQFVLVSYYPLSALLGKPTGSSAFIAPRNRNVDQPAENRLQR